MVLGTHSKEELRAQKKAPLPLEQESWQLAHRVGVTCFVLAPAWAPLAFASNTKDPEVPDTSVTPWVFW